jgi:hypothetical protein
MKNSRITSAILLGVFFLITSCDTNDDEDPINPDPLSVCDVSNLIFTTTTTFNMPSGNSVQVNIVGVDLVGNPGTNSLYMTDRYEANPDGHMVRKFDLNSNTISESIGPTDRNWSTTRAFFANNQLHVAKSIYFSLWDSTLNFISAQEYSDLPAGIVGSWFDIAYNYDTSVLYFAGARDNGIGGAPTNKIKSYDIASNTFTDVGILPEYYAMMGMEYHNNKLYFFGGFKNDDSSVPENFINDAYIYDLNSNTTQVIPMPYDLFRGLTTISGDCIFVAGRTSANQTKIGKFDTTTNTYTDLTHNLNFSGETNTIIAMAAMNDKLYVLFNEPGSSEDEFEIKEVSLL